MKRICSLLLCLSSLSYGEIITELTKNATLLFEDQFNQEEEDDSKEQLGQQWVTNSVKRAKGVKQGDISEGSLVMTTAEVADHGVAIRHDIPHQNGIIQLRFQIHDKQGMRINYNDPKARKVCHAGHIAGFGIKPGFLTIEDHKEGLFNLKFRDKRENRKEFLKLIEGKTKKFKANVKINQWHELIIITKGDTSTIYLDNKQIGSLSSGGLAHNLKQNVEFGVSKKATVDWIKVWSIE